MRTLVAVVVVCGALVGACGRPSALSLHEFELAVAKLEVKPPALSASIESMRWQEELARADAQLERIAPWTSFGASPAWWQVERRLELAQAMQRVEETLTTYLALAESAPQTSNDVGITRLALLRNRTNHLCAAAVLANGSDEAERWLETALVLARLTGEDSSWSANVRCTAAGIVVDAARCIARERETDAKAILAGLEPLLASFHDPRAIGQALASDLRAIVARGEHFNASADELGRALELVTLARRLALGERFPAAALVLSQNSPPDPFAHAYLAAAGTLFSNERLFAAQ